MMSEKIKRSNDALASMDDKSSPAKLVFPSSASSVADELQNSSLKESPKVQSSPAAVESSASRKIYLSDLGPLEQLVVRQLATLKLQSMLEKFISYEEIAEMSEPGKQGVFEKFLGAFKSGKKNVVKGMSHANSVFSIDGTFGVPIDVLVEKAGVDTDLAPDGTSSTRIPILIEACIKALQTMDLSVEGIFRKNGNIKRLKTVTDTLDDDPFAVDFTDDNPIQVAALLKKFLREMPDPLLTFRLHKLFVTTLRKFASFGGNNACSRIAYRRIEEGGFALCVLFAAQTQR